MILYFLYMTVQLQINSSMKTQQKISPEPTVIYNIVTRKRTTRMKEPIQRSCTPSQEKSMSRIFDLTGVCPEDQGVT